MVERDVIYAEQDVPDYRDNPLIEPLPPIWGVEEVIDMLSHIRLINKQNL